MDSNTDFAVTRHYPPDMRGHNAGKEKDMLENLKFTSPNGGIREGGDNILVDLAALRLSQDFTSNVPAKKVLVTIPLRKPSRHDFIRVHPTMEFTTYLLELKEERGEVYVVAPSVAATIPNEVTAKTLLAYVNRQGVLALWPLSPAREDGRLESWSASAAAAADLAKSSWVRVASNMPLRAYEAYKANGIIPEPVWPEESWEQILTIAFRDCLIADVNHPVLRRLRGE